MIELMIGEKQCRIWAEGEAEYILVQPTGQHELEALEDECRHIRLASEKNFAFVSIAVDDWNKELSPWRARQAFGGEPFGEGAEKTLTYMTDKLIPSLDEQIEIRHEARYILGGYSLAGLFSLWSAYQTSVFSAIAACSPSVWLDNWMDYAETHHPMVRNIYLSLGNKEHKTRNPMLRSVRDCIVRQHEILQNSGINTQLEMNSGNHFQENMERLVKGFLWCLNV